MREGHEDDIEAIESCRIGGRVGQIRIGRGQRWRVPGDVDPRMLPGGGHRHVEVRMLATQTEQLDAQVSRRTNHSHLHDTFLNVRSSVQGLCKYIHKFA